MKFIIDSKIFRTAVERVSVICAKTGIPSTECIFVDADKESKRLTIHADNLETGAAVYIDNVKIIDDGKFASTLNYIKRLFNVSGEVTIWTDEKSIRIKNDKKQCQIPTQKAEDREIISLADGLLFEADKDDFVNTLSKINKFRAIGESKPIYTGFNINSTKERIAATGL